MREKCLTYTLSCIAHANALPSVQVCHICTWFADPEAAFPEAVFPEVALKDYAFVCHNL